MEKFTLENFKYNTYAWNVITTEGKWTRNWSGELEWYINDSDILTRLIQEAGRFCENYASDLFYDWEAVRKNYKDIEFYERTFLFGFRKDGVDCLDQVLNRYEYEGSAARGNYRSLWRLGVEDSGDERITMTLGRVF